MRSFSLARQLFPASAAPCYSPSYTSTLRINIQYDLGRLCGPELMQHYIRCLGHLVDSLKKSYLSMNLVQKYRKIPSEKVGSKEE